MKELVVISGKGGTGKTSVSASFAAMSKRSVIVDCDVDAADLHLLLSPEVKSRIDFYSGHEASIQPKLCNNCGLCFSYCRFDAILRSESASEHGFTIDPISCEGCGVCAHFCPQQAIVLSERLCGEWMISDTRYGPMLHAQLGIAAENSGKLVSKLREEARRLSKSQERELIIIDGPPGIGCAVIASIAGAALVLVVTEPTVAGEHDLERVLALTRHFRIHTAVCINKWDINPDLTLRIESKAQAAGVQLAGRIRYDPSVTAAQIQAQTVIETNAPSAQDIRQVWQRLIFQLDMKQH